MEKEIHVAKKDGNEMPRKPDLSIIGKTYNNLIVDELTDQRNSYGKRLYSCTCLLCGNKRLASKQNLEYNEIKDCGNHRPIKDITGQKFGYLTAEYPIRGEKHGKDSTIVWHCKCICGEYVDVTYQHLIKGHTISCGHNKKEKLKELFVEGTAPCKLKENKRSTNTSGVTGVYYDKSREKWCAEIMFQRKKYFLGRYDDFNDAVKARKIGEENIHGAFLDWYENEYKKQIPQDN